VALDGIATFVAGYATFVGLAKLISTFVAGCATSVGLAKLISTFVADCATFVGLVKLIATFVDPCRIAHTPFTYPGSGGGSLCARWVGTHQHPSNP
jgi:hypothetical protein